MQAGAHSHVSTRPLQFMYGCNLCPSYGKHVESGVVRSSTHTSSQDKDIAISTDVINKRNNSEYVPVNI